jgi:eukaryotic-like serine/threonine-protein kinase
LLFVIDNTGVGGIDTSHNGLWKVNTDGTGLTRLTSNAADETTTFTYTRSLRSTISPDGGSYAVQVTDTSSRSSSLLIGSMNGGEPVAFASLPGKTGTRDTLDIAGWTTMR